MRTGAAAPGAGALGRSRPRGGARCRARSPSCGTMRLCRTPAPPAPGRHAGLAAAPAEPAGGGAAGMEGDRLETPVSTGGGGGRTAGSGFAVRSAVAPCAAGDRAGFGVSALAPPGTCRQPRRCRAGSGTGGSAVVLARRAGLARGFIRRRGSVPLGRRSRRRMNGAGVIPCRAERCKPRRERAGAGQPVSALAT